MPADFIYNILSFKLFKLILVGMKEVQRVYAIQQGVTFAIKKYPSYYLVQVVAGVLKGKRFVTFANMYYPFLFQLVVLNKGYH